MITSDELKRIARLAKISLEGEDIDALIAETTEIVKIAQIIDSVDLSLLDCRGDNDTAVLREDNVIPPLPSDLLLKNAAGKRDSYFVAPGVNVYKGISDEHDHETGADAQGKGNILH